MAEKDNQGIVAMINSVPGLRQGLLLVGLALSIAAGLWIVFWSQQPGYQLLYSNLTDRDAADVVKALQVSGIDYQLDETGGAIRVRGENLHEARLQLASQGLPGSGGVGLEMIQAESGITVSQFMEGAKYQHALETELSRTIVSMRPVERARVHLAIPRQTVFLRERHPPSASVLVHLYPGRALEPAQINSVVNLVASSIPELQTTRITVVDQNGRLLNAPGENGDLAVSAAQFEQRQRIEKEMARRIESMLSAMLGLGRVRATVSADVDFTVSEETRESYNPDGNVMRSEQTSEEVRRDEGAAGGVPGAASNQPGDTAQDARAADAVSETRQATRNYELDKTVRHVRGQVGEIRRLSVAVLVDNARTVNEDGSTTAEPLTAQQLDEVRGLVREVVGFDAERGDSVNVVNASFHEQAAPAEVPAASFLEQGWIRDVLRQLAAIVVAMVLLFTVVRPMMKGLMTIPVPQKAPTPGVELGADGLVRTVPPPAPSYDERIAAARAIANKDPQRVAQVVKDWVGNEG